MHKDYKEKNKINEEDLLISKIEDKINYAKTRNKITYTDFFNIVEKSKIEKYLKQQEFKNYFSFGGNSNTERCSYIFYPDKLDENMVRNNLNNIFCVVRIKNSKEDEYEHRIFLSALMKLGLKREKIGDIIVQNDGADIVIFKENAIYIENSLKQLTRFRKSKIDVIDIRELSNKEIEFEDISIIVSSIRLDCFISELANFSRAKAEEYIELGKVFLNSYQEYKASRKIVVDDIITIRGKGKFIFKEIIKETSKGKFLVSLKKYI